MITRIIVLVIFIISGSELHGQLYDAEQRKQLKNLLEELKLKQKDRLNRIYEFLNEKSFQEQMAINQKIKSGYYLYDIENGIPLYKHQFNSDAAAAMGINEVRSGGRFGLNLEGEGMNIGIWDGGLIRTTHSEFQGRISYYDGAATSVYSDHATGVVGTLMGSGINPLSKGMAPEATGIAYDFNNDEVEMLEAQMIKEIVVSNHSYGLIAGWNNGQWVGDVSISNMEDYRFGFYDNSAKTWDDIAFNAPYYLIVKSAGNDRGQSGSGTYPADGPYDCIASASTAKNIMVVGAVQKSQSGYNDPQNILMSSFSGWGPTDDGRIKPDIVGIGVNIFTSASDNDNDYQSTSGTSFSSPAVCGGLALIQEFHKSKYNQYMRSSSLKALAIHTAKQTGFPGPDYRYGWGLMNVEGAIEFIQNEDGRNYDILEDRLMEGESYTIEIEPLANTEARFTLAWTDPSGVPVQASLDPEDLMLVNDLDIRLVDETGNEFFPYILDPSNPQAAAQKGENFRDNVEQIYLDNIEERKYFLNISHKGNLMNGFQDFSLIIEYQSTTNQLTSLYWIGDQGSWNDGNNWSLNSGGFAAGVLPDSNYRVIIDDNSFVNNNSVIELDKDYNVGSISSFATRDYTINLNGYTLNSKANIKLNGNNLSIRNGKLGCNSNIQEQTYSINLDKAITDSFSLVLPELNTASWQIVNNKVNIKNIEIHSGSLIINSSQLTVENIDAGIPDIFGSSELIICNSTITISGVFDLIGCSEYLDNVQSNIIFNTSINSNCELRTNGFDMNSFITCFESDLNILANSSRFTNTSFESSNVKIVGDLFMNTLSLSGDIVMELDTNSILAVNEDFTVSNENEEAVLLQGSSEGTSALSLLFHKKLCLENIQVTNLPLLGEASVSVGINGSIDNSPGWSDAQCDKLLFADFDVNFPCVSAQTEFMDESDGIPVIWEWYINSDLRSTEQTYYVSFQDTQTIDITLVVFDQEGISSSYTSQITIRETPLDSNTIIISTPDILASQKPAESYQWYKNNLPIPGATNRTYVFNGELAEYFVITFEDGCNRKSKVLDLLTSTKELVDSEPYISLHPNPFNNYLDIEFKENMGNRGHLYLYGINGDLVVKKELKIDLQNVKLELAAIPSGMYILMIFTDEQAIRAKLIKN